MKLVKFDCGCIGFRPSKSDINRAWIIRCCDRDDNNYTLTYRVMTSPHYGGRAQNPFEWLDDETATKHLETMNSVLRDGYRLREIKSLLGVYPAWTSNWFTYSSAKEPHE